MITQLFRKARIHLLIALDERYTLEGFERTRKKFESPENFSSLDPHTKRELTICNLFANQNQSLWDIARLLDVTMSKVVTTLIQNGLIRERRVREARAKQERRQKPLQVQPMSARALEVPAQVDLPSSTSERIARGALQAGNDASSDSMRARKLAS